MNSLSGPCTPNPANCSLYTFSAADGEVYLPWWHGLFRADVKGYRGVTIAGVTLSATSYAQFEYKLDPAAAAYTALGVDFTSGPTQYAEFPTSPSSRLSDFRVRLLGTRPVVNALALHHNVRPALILAYEFDVLCAEGLLRRDAGLLRGDPQKIRDEIRAAVGSPGPTNVTLPDESNQDLAFIDLAEATSWDERLRMWTASVHCKAVQARVNTIYGTVLRLGAYRVGDLSGTSIAQLAFL